MKSNRSGFNLVEAVVGTGILLMFVLALYGLMVGALAIVNDDQNRSAALGIARKKIELIKNLPYDSVGTVGGVPAGDLLQTETEVLNNVTYTIKTNIQYVDDEFDDVAPTDTLNTDYKKVRIRVTWSQGNSDNPVILVTNIVPTTIESNATGGTIWIEVFDPTTSPLEPVANADVTIEAPTLIPPISTTGETDSDGRFILPGVPAGVEAYEVTVTKTNYSTDQTYDRDALLNPNPDPPHLNVVDGEITQEYFEISRQVNLLAIHLRSVDTGEPHPDIPFRLHGELTKGTDGNGQPIYSYDEILTTNAGGNAELHDLPADSYSVLIDEASVGYVIAGYDHILPYPAAALSSETIIVDLDDYVPYTALINVRDSNNVPIADASVKLMIASVYNTTINTDVNGQAFFTPLSADTYELTITAAGYTTYTGTVIVNGNEEQIHVL
ncbi:MAG: carboxypeptidase regulatory-like domain-containing protein [Candidatus Kerfeldbacteria bacterium]|nr:carboxypeptidase regulatory-like domain-containing protein [Candidatus Kerfeldbacteria bacterium]